VTKSDKVILETLKLALEKKRGAALTVVGQAAKYEAHMEALNELAWILKHTD
jgi:hypothetical protein